MIESVLNGRKCCCDALGIGNLSGLLVLRNIEVDANEDAFAGEVEVFDRFLAIVVEKGEGGLKIGFKV